MASCRMPSASDLAGLDAAVSQSLGRVKDFIEPRLEKALELGLQPLEELLEALPSGFPGFLVLRASRGVFTRAHEAMARAFVNDRLIDLADLFHERL